MVTGDDLLTAKAIAMECGILTATSDINTTILASNFSSMSDAEREEIAENILVSIIMFLPLFVGTEILQRIK